MTELEEVIENLKIVVKDLEQSNIELLQMKDENLLLKERTEAQLKLNPDDDKFKSVLTAIERSIHTLDFMINDNKAYICEITGKLATVRADIEIELAKAKQIE